MGVLINRKELLEKRENFKNRSTSNDGSQRNGNYGEDYFIDLLPGRIEASSHNEDYMDGVDFKLKDLGDMIFQSKAYSGSYLFDVYQNDKVLLKHEWNKEKHIDLVGQLHKFMVTGQWIKEPKIMTIREYREQYIKPALLDEFMDKINDMSKKIFVSSWRDPQPYIDSKFGRYLNDGVLFRTKTEGTKTQVILEIHRYYEIYTNLLLSRKINKT